MRAAAVIEKAGIPTVTFGASAFAALGEAVARLMSVPWVPMVLYPGVPLSDSSEEFERKVGAVAPAVVDALVTEPTFVDPTDVPRFDAGAIVVRGTLDGVHAAFEERLWTDGLPIIPPTPDRVEEFLRHTPRRPDEVLGELLPARRLATVQSVAVNGVMAGCLPSHMPLLVAAVECIADPAWHVEHAGSTPGWEPIVIVSSPRIDELGFNTGAGALRVGRRANSSVGRFLRLYLRNVAGLRIPPGATDQGAIAGNFNVALAENDDHVRSLGWPTYREDHGHDPSVTVVGVQSVMTAGVPIYSAGDTADDHLWSIVRCMGDTIGLWAAAGIVMHEYYPVLILGPSVATALHDLGLDKDSLRHYLWQRLTVRAGDIERFAPQCGGPSDFSIAGLVDAGALPSHYATTRDPDRMIPMLIDADSIQIVVAGNAGRNQSKVLINQGLQGRPITRAAPGA